MRFRDEQKIENIYNATLKLSGSYGLAGLTMNKIAKEAKIAHGTLYIYFENKEVLLNKLYIHILQKGTISKMSSVADLPVKKQLEMMWESSLKYRIANPYLLVFRDQFIISSYISEEGKNLDGRFLTFFEKLMTKGKKEGVIKSVSNQILLSLLFGFLKGMAERVVRSNKGLTKKTLEDSFAVCWDAIRVLPEQKEQRHR